MAENRLSHEAFFLRAIETLKPEGREGVHTVFSGFNEAFRDYFPGDDPVVVMKSLAEAGKIKLRTARGGAVIYPPDFELPNPKSAKDVLGKMGVTK